MESFKYDYYKVLKMDYLLYLDHIYYLNIIEAEKSLNIMRIYDNNLWLQSKDTGARNNYGKLYKHYESEVKKIKEVKKINTFNPEQLDKLFGKFRK